MIKIAKAATAAVAIVASAGVVHAASHHVAIGKIERLNAEKHQLVLDHHTYKYSPKIATKSLQQGENIKVFYRQWGGHRTAYKIVPMTG